MDDSGAYVNEQLVKPNSRTPSRAEPDVSYVDFHFKTLSDPRVQTGGELNFGKDEHFSDEGEDPPIASGPGEMRVTTQTDGLNSTHSLLNPRSDELHIDEYENLPVASRPAELSVAAEAGAHKQEANENIGNRPDRKIYLLCLVTAVLVAIVAGLSIHVLQIRQYQEMNGTQQQYGLNQPILESKLSEYSRISILEKNITVLNSDLSVLNRAHNNLRQQFNRVEMEYRTSTESKAQICQYLTRRRDQKCSHDWIRNEDRCYFISTLSTSYDEVKEHCSNFDARLLKINSKQEENVVSNALVHQHRTYWIGKCEDGEEASSLMYTRDTGTSICGTCDSSEWRNHCIRQHPFICEKCVHLCTDIPEKIHDLCQQSLGST